LFLLGRLHPLEALLQLASILLLLLLLLQLHLSLHELVAGVWRQHRLLLLLLLHGGWS